MILVYLLTQNGGVANTKIQSIMFNNKKYDSKKARKWLKKYNYKPIKRVDKTKNYLRYRIREPNEKLEYRIISFNKDIKAVIEILKPDKKYIKI